MPSQEKSLAEALQSPDLLTFAQARERFHSLQQSIYPPRNPRPPGSAARIQEEQDEKERRRKEAIFQEKVLAYLTSQAQQEALKSGGNQPKITLESDDPAVPVFQTTMSEWIRIFGEVRGKIAAEELGDV